MPTCRPAPTARKGWENRNVEAMPGPDTVQGRGHPRLMRSYRFAVRPSKAMATATMPATPMAQVGE